MDMPKAELDLDSEPWVVSRRRTIDKQTMIDIMLFVEFQARRTEMLERAGFTDDFCSSDKMFDYVLDAIGAPANGEQLIQNGVTRYFSREWFYQLFYSDYILQKGENGLSVAEVLKQIVQELASDLSAHCHAEHRGFPVQRIVR
jgi:hypothetical protein